MPPSNEPRDRNFRNGLMAHLIMVPAWTVAPALLLGSLIVTGLPYGLPGVLVSFVTGAGLMMSSNMLQRGPVSLCLIGGLGFAAPSRKFTSTSAACLAAFLAWLCKGGKGDYKRRPKLRHFLDTWAGHFYQQAELRGHLDNIKKEKSCFGFHPHGCLAAGFTVNGCYNPTFRERAGKVNWLCDYNLRYKNPFFRMKCDAVSDDDVRIDAADKKTFVKLMERGENMSLTPGGFQEAVAQRHGKDCAVVLRRKGFIKYCLQYGYRIHPVYTFGESSTFYTFTGLRKLRMRISENNIPMVAFFGWPLFPLLPRPDTNLLTYVGAGIDVPHIPEPTTEDVNKWHGEYIKGLANLYNEYKAEAGYSNAELEIV